MYDHINLLPTEYEQAKSSRRLVLGWMKLGLALLACGGTLYAGLWSHRQTLREAVRAGEPEVAPLQRLETEISRIQREKQTLRGRQSLLHQLEQGRYPLKALGVVSQSAAPLGEQFQIQDFSFTVQEPSPASPQNRPKPPASPATDPPEKTITRVIVKGVARDDLTLGRFLSGLREAGVFESVRLISSEAGLLGTLPARQYHVELTL